MLTWLQASIRHRDTLEPTGLLSTVPIKAGQAVNIHSFSLTAFLLHPRHGPLTLCAAERRMAARSVTHKKSIYIAVIYAQYSQLCRSHKGTDNTVSAK